MLFINKAKAYKETLTNSERNRKDALRLMLMIAKQSIKFALKDGKFHTQVFFSASEKIELIPEFTQFLVKRGYDVKENSTQGGVNITISWQEE